MKKYSLFDLHLSSCGSRLSDYHMFLRKNHYSKCLKNISDKIHLDRHTDTHTNEAKIKPKIHSCLALCHKLRLRQADFKFKAILG